MGSAPVIMHYSYLVANWCEDKISEITFDN